MKHKAAALLCLLAACLGVGCQSQYTPSTTDTVISEAPQAPAKDPIDQKVDSLLALMTLEEKAGQLNFPVGDLFNTGPTVRTTESARFDDQIRQGQITGLFNVHGAAYTKRLQELAVKESRLGIPLLFGADVIHGFKTVFPIPLASAASWDMQAVELAERIAAAEATSAGITFNFAPMVDLARDPRWGRIAEGAGEDPYLGALVAQARVRGFQGNNLEAPNTLAACAKHFAAYGAPFGGRDYNTVDMSEQSLREAYLVPYKAAVDAGVATFMTSFNELNGVPATASEWLLRDLLRGEWGFKGMVVSDWQSIGEMMIHGYSVDSAQAAVQSLRAGCDMDMMSYIYLTQLPQLVRSGQLDERYLDEAVRNVLRLKFQLGLFEDPYRYSNIETEQKTIRQEAHLAAAREVARKSIVLLKNEKELLPLSGREKTIAVIGPLADAQADMNGTWSFFGEPQHAVSILQGIKERAGAGTKVLHAQGANLYDNSTALFAEAVATAKKADVVLLVVGESAVMNGEGASRSSLDLPGVQQQLVEAVQATGKPVVVILQNGRPLAIEWIAQHVPAIVEAWTLGSESGHAIADVLWGDYNPSGKLPVTFPRNVGQVPIFYNHKNTGRPYEGDHVSEKLSERVYRSRYRDVPNTPLYPFGWGLSYTTFAYSAPRVNKTNISMGDSVIVSLEVKNTGSRPGTETVQLYLRDMVGSLTRPVKELKGFQQLTLQPGEQKSLQFVLKEEDLAFWRADGTFGAEAGVFKVMTGGNSQDVQEVTFRLDGEKTALNK